jgi:hypothetical protein
MLRIHKKGGGGVKISITKYADFAYQILKNPANSRLSYFIWIDRIDSNYTYCILCCKIYCISGSLRFWLKKKADNDAILCKKNKITINSKFIGRWVYRYSITLKIPVRLRFRVNNFTQIPGQYAGHIHFNIFSISIWYKLAVNCRFMLRLMWCLLNMPDLVYYVF